MKIAALIFSLVSLLPICAVADNPVQIYKADDLEQFQVTYNSGYTVVSIYGYSVKITAEQRTTDNMAQVVILPREEGIQFQILNVEFTVLPQGNDIGGPVAQVGGVFTVQYTTGSPITVSKVIPVQLAFVDDFSMSADEARVEGDVVFQKQLPSLLSSST